MASSSSSLALFINLFLFVLLPSSASPTQGNKREFNLNAYKYPFIEKASSFSSSLSSFTTSNGEDSSFDYIIIGGGTAGCPLAATLSENFKVLVLERGGVPFTNTNLTLSKNFLIGLTDTSASQEFVSTDGVINARARVLGGATAINAGFYSRANPEFLKTAGWDPVLVNESYPWIERVVAHQPQLALWQKALRDSLLDVGITPFNGFTYDHIYGTKIGGTIFDRFGRRHTAAELLSYANPQKLKVLIHATVQKIIFDTSGKRPRATGVIFKDENGKQHQVLLSNRQGSEVILSSGAIGSPQMLMLSGIGPKNDLEKLNITVILQNEFVGKDMVDNPMNQIFVPSKIPLDQSLLQTVGITKKGVYIEGSSGFIPSNDSSHSNHGIMSAEIGQLSTLPPKQRTREAIQAYIKNKKDLPDEVFKGGFVLEKIANPLSRGHLSLNNTNVDDNPSITFNYFSHPLDLQRCVEGIQLISEIITSKYFRDIVQTEKQTIERLLNMSTKANINLIPKQINDTKSLAQFCKDTMITLWHYHGGCHVDQVVSSDLRVLGVDSLRVIDSSTFNESPGTNPQATVMMMGRYMGVKILRERANL